MGGAKKGTYLNRGGSFLPSDAFWAADCSGWSGAIFQQNYNPGTRKSEMTDVSQPHPSQCRYQCFIRKAHASCRECLPAESASSPPDRAESGACENDRQEKIKICPRRQKASSRAHYNRLIGEMILEEAQYSSEIEQSIDSDRIEDLLLLME